MRWVSDRSEHFFACAQGRDNLTHAEMALDEKGKFLGIRVKLDAIWVPYLSICAFHSLCRLNHADGCYDIPVATRSFAASIRIPCRSTPIVARGGPEAAYTIERLVDFIADEIGMDRIALRKLNLVKPRQMPYTTPTGRVYDTGEFAAHMKQAIEKADWKGFPARLRAAKKKGLIRALAWRLYRGLWRGWCRARHVTLEKDGTRHRAHRHAIERAGHETAYAQLVAEHLDIPLSQIRVRQGDTKEIPSGSGTGGSRSIPVGGAGVALAAEGLAKTLKKLAANALEAGEGDLEIADGAVRIAGTDRRIGFAEIAALPAAKKAMLTETAAFKPPKRPTPTARMWPRWRSTPKRAKSAS